MDDSAIKCDEFIGAEAKSNGKETKTFPTNFNEKNITYKTQNFYILVTFLLITIALLIAVSIYCYLIKYHGKQKYLLPFHNTNWKKMEKTTIKFGVIEIEKQKFHQHKGHISI